MTHCPLCRQRVLEDKGAAAAAQAAGNGRPATVQPASAQPAVAHADGAAVMPAANDTVSPANGTAQDDAALAAALQAAEAAAPAAAVRRSVSTSSAPDTPRRLATLHQRCAT